MSIYKLAQRMHKVAAGEMPPATPPIPAEEERIAIPTIQDVFSKRQEAAQFRRDALIEKAKADVLKQQSTGKADMEELMARFQLLAESAEASYQAELNTVKADELKLGAQKDLKMVGEGEKEEQAELKKQEDMAKAEMKAQEDQQKAQNKALALPIQQMGGVPGQGMNPMADPALQMQAMAQQAQMGKQAAAEETVIKMLHKYAEAPMSLKAVPVIKKRTLTTEEERDIAEESRKFLRAPFAVTSDPAVSKMADPVKRAAAIGMVTTVPLLSIGSRTNLPLLPVLVGSLSAGSLASLYVYLRERQKNATIKEQLRRLPEDATIHDMNQDTAYRKMMNRAVQGELGHLNNAALLAALASQR
jgi:hypothetical protein